MTDDHNRIGSSRKITAILISMLIAAMFLLFYGVVSQDGLASISILILIPAALGGLVTQYAYPKGDAPYIGCFVLPTLAICILIAAGVIFKNEGVICVAMVLPIWIAAAISGAIVNKSLAKFENVDDQNNVKIRSVVWFVFPMMIFVIESENSHDWQYREIVREVTINATPEKIWPLLNSIDSIQSFEGKPNFTQDILGVPRPNSAKIEIIDQKMVRKARWGDDVSFDEKITNFIVNKEIAWDFYFLNNSVQNHTDQHISPDGELLKVISGGYQIFHQGNGKTRLRLVTRYRMRTALPFYVGWWGEYLFGDIQMNILEIIRQRAE